MFSRPSTGERKLKKAPFGSDKKVGENRKYFVRNISRLSQTNKQKKHILNILCLLEIHWKLKKSLIWLKTAEEPLLCDWQWHSSDTEGALPWIWVRLDAMPFPVSPKWLGNIQNYIVRLQIWALPAHKVCSSSSSLLGIQTLTVYAACQTSLCPLSHMSMLFFYMVVQFTHTPSRLSGIQKTWRAAIMRKVHLDDGFNTDLTNKYEQSFQWMRLKCSTFYPVWDWQSGLCCHLVEGIKFYSDRSDFIPRGWKSFL